LTGLSIFWYALFDWEFEKEGPKYSGKIDEKPKEYLMTTPHLYGIGLRNDKFNNVRFWKWISLGWL